MRIFGRYQSIVLLGTPFSKAISPIECIFQSLHNCHFAIFGCKVAIDYYSAIQAAIDIFKPLVISFHANFTILQHKELWRNSWTPCAFPSKSIFSQLELFSTNSKASVAFRIHISLFSPNRIVSALFSNSKRIQLDLCPFPHQFILGTLLGSAIKLRSRCPKALWWCWSRFANYRPGNCRIAPAGNLFSWSEILEIPQLSHEAQ